MRKTARGAYSRTASSKIRYQTDQAMYLLSHGRVRGSKWQAADLSGSPATRHKLAVLADHAVCTQTRHRGLSGQYGNS